MFMFVRVPFSLHICRDDDDYDDDYDDDWASVNHAQSLCPKKTITFLIF